MKKTFKYHLLLLIQILAFQVLSQNLIPNGSFEEFKKSDNPYAPKIITNLAGGWEAFTTTPHKIYQPWISVSRKVEKSPNPDGYIALCCNNFQAVKDKQMIKSFFQVPLNEFLLKDSLYRLDFYYKITVSSIDKVTRDSLIDERFVELCLLDKKLNNINESESIPKDIFTAMLPKGTYFKDYRSHPIKWNSSSCIIKARGGEKYLLFGIFGTNYTKYWCTLYFDDLKLQPLSHKISNIAESEVGTSFVIENILFETDKSILKEASYDALNSLILELNTSKKVKIEISGHTDDTGTDEHNNQLSEQRAKAVFDYLVQHGIDNERLSYKGYGSSLPVAENSTENGRAKNRRVEITIIDK